MMMWDINPKKLRKVIKTTLNLKKIQNSITASFSKTLFLPSNIPKWV